MARLADTELDVFPLCLGGNVFGWTMNEGESFAVLDAYAEAGGNFVDTADMYSHWVPGQSGGESETIIGNWMASRGNRDRIVVATKVGRGRGKADLRADTIRSATDDCLRRLQIDCIDLLYAHGDDDPSIPLEETLGAFEEIVQAGKARYIAASNYTPERLAAALALGQRDGFASYVALQPHYNLAERARYEGPLQQLCLERGLACLPYYALASGFLTGKYRPGGGAVDSRRGGGAELLDQRGLAILAALDEVAGAQETTVAAVALAWLAAQPTVATPIASARTPGQLAELLPMADLTLSRNELDLLDRVSA